MQQVRLSSPIFRQPSILLKSTRLHLVQAPHMHGPTTRPTAPTYKPHTPKMQTNVHPFPAPNTLLSNMYLQNANKDTH